MYKKNSSTSSCANLIEGRDRSPYVFCAVFVAADDAASQRINDDKARLGFRVCKEFDYIIYGVFVEKVDRFWQDEEILCFQTVDIVCLPSPYPSGNAGDSLRSDVDDRTREDAISQPRGSARD